MKAANTIAAFEDPHAGCSGGTDNLRLDMAAEAENTRLDEAVKIENATEALESVVLPLLTRQCWQSGPDTFHCILEGRLYLGGDRVCPDELRKVGITHVVRVIEDDLSSVLPKQELRSTLFIPATDSKTTDLRPHFPRLRSFVADAWGSAGVVYVHCGMGRSRSCTLVLACLVLLEGMSLLEAFIHVLSQRDVLLINIGFLAQLVELDEDTHGRQSLPLLAAFAFKMRRNRHVAADTECRFDVAELLAWWMGSAEMIHRQNGMARAEIRHAVNQLRESLEEIVPQFIQVPPLQSRCFQETKRWLDEGGMKVQGLCK